MSRINLFGLALVAGFSLIMVYSCQENQDQTASFELLQSRILTPTCAVPTCHSAVTDDSFSQHGLVLEKSVAYENLIEANSKNLNASSDGLLLVKPFEPKESLLLHKMHMYDHHTQDYGNPMPLGLSKLSVGQVEFIEEWILAGAPRTGVVANAALLDDKTRQEEHFEPLAVPATGQGFQVNLPKFSIAANFEREFFVYKKLGNTSEVFVNRFEIKMRMNSHHLVLYDFDPATPPLALPIPEMVRDIRNPDNSLNIINLISIPYHIFVFGAQSPYLNY